MTSSPHDPEDLTPDQADRDEEARHTPRTPPPPPEPLPRRKRKRRASAAGGPAESPEPATASPPDADRDRDPDPSVHAIEREDDSPTSEELRELLKERKRKAETRAKAEKFAAERASKADTQRAARASYGARGGQQDDLDALARRSNPDEYELSEELRALVRKHKRNPAAKADEHTPRWRDLKSLAVGEINREFLYHGRSYRRIGAIAEERMYREVMPGYEKARQDVMPLISLQDDLSKGHEASTIAAVIRMPAMAWLFIWLQLCARGRSGFRSLPVAALITACMTRGRPHLNRGRDEVLASPALDVAFAFPVYQSRDLLDSDQLTEERRRVLERIARIRLSGALEGSEEAQLARGLNGVMKRHEDEVLVHINVEAFKKIAEKANRKKKNGPDCAEICHIDAQFLHSDCVNRWYSIAERVEMKKKKGKLWGVENIKTKTPPYRPGRKRLAIVCSRTGRAIVWMYIPGDSKEYKNAPELIELLFRVWPECPIKVLVGDTDYESSDVLHEFMLFRCAIWPVFRRRADSTYTMYEPDGTPKAYLHDEETGARKRAKKGKVGEKVEDPKYGVEGVPRCPTEGHGLMRMHDTNGEFTATQRMKMVAESKAARDALRDGTLAGASPKELEKAQALADRSFPLPADQARGKAMFMRYVCDACGSAREPVQVKVRDEVKLYSKYPRAGSGVWSARRVAYENHRNRIESFHAELGWLSGADASVSRILQDTDEKVKWMDGLTVLMTTLRVLVALDGSQKAWQAKLAGMGIGTGNSSVGRDAVVVQPITPDVRVAMREELETLAEAPESWKRCRGVTEWTLLGYNGEQRRVELEAEWAATPGDDDNAGEEAEAMAA